VFFTGVISRWFAPLIRPVFSRSILREALRFGLPRIPHSVAHQVIGLADRYFLNAFGTLHDVGLYSIGASFGLALKLFVGAFEAAWTPFFLGVMREPNPQRVYATVSTYVIAVLVLLTAGLCAVASDVVRLTTTAEFHEAARVTPWIALGVMFQGAYIVGSIGLVITKRTARYPLATGGAAAASLLANAWLIPRYGLMGAAWANTLAYATLAVVTITFSLRLYPIPYEWSRLLRIAAAGLVAFVASNRLVPSYLSPFWGLALHGVLVTGAYAAVLYATEKFRNDNPKTYRAFTAALAEAAQFVRANPDAAADIYLKVNKSNIDRALLLSIIKSPQVEFKVAPQNTLGLAQFLVGCRRLGQLLAREPVGKPERASATPGTSCPNSTSSSMRRPGSCRSASSTWRAGRATRRSGSCSRGC